MQVSLDEFVARIDASRLLPDEEIAACRELLSSDAGPADIRELARRLISEKKLTQYQVKEIYDGRADHLVLGEYIVLDKIGAGGMGHVFKARHRTMNRIVALKALPSMVVDRPKALERFHREIKAAGQLSHANIVTAHDAGVQGDVHFLVMEYVDGEDLATTIKRSGPLPVEQAIDVTVQAARGLQHAHCQGVVHRDLKPSNLMLDRDGCVKVLDLGLALLEYGESQIDALTRSGQVMGTADYMSPEQAIDSRHVDHRTDIYALGCTLYALVNGKPPYRRGAPIETMLAHREAEIPPLADGRDDVPEFLDAIFVKLAVKNPDDRYASMDEVIDDLTNRRVPAVVPPRAGLVSDFAATVQRSRVRDSTLPTTPRVAAARGNNNPTIKLTEPFVAPAAQNRKRVVFAGLGVAAVLLGAILVWMFTRSGGNRHDEIPHAVAVRDSARGTDDDRLDASATETPTRTYEPVDLLRLIDPERDTLNTDWHFDGGALVCEYQGRTQVCPIMSIPYVLPEEYQITVEMTRTEGRRAMIVGLVVGGRPCKLQLDWSTGELKLKEHFYGIEHIDGRGVYEGNESTRTGPIIPLDTKNTFVCTVRKRHVHATLNGEAVVDWRGDFQRISLVSPVSQFGKEGSERVQQRALPFIGSYSSGFRFSCIELLPLSGPGEDLTVRTLTGHAGQVKDVAVLGATRQFASAGADGAICIWNLDDAQLVRKVGRPRGAIIGLAASQDGSVLMAAGADGSVRVWNLATDEQPTVLEELVTRIDCSPNGNQFVATSSDDCRIWDMATGESRVIARRAYVFPEAVTWSPDGNTVAAFLGRNSLLFDTATGKRRAGLSLPTQVYDLTFSADSQFVASAPRDGNIQIFDASTGSSIAKWPAHEDWVQAVAFSPDGKTLASGSADQTIKLWDIQTTTAWRMYRGHTGRVHSIAFSPDGTTLISASDDGTVKLWHVPSDPSHVINEAARTVDANPAEANSTKETEE